MQDEKIYNITLYHKESHKDIVNFFKGKEILKTACGKFDLCFEEIPVYKIISDFKFYKNRDKQNFKKDESQELNNIKFCDWVCSFFESDVVFTLQEVKKNQNNYNHQSFKLIITTNLDQFNDICKTHKDGTFYQRSNGLYKIYANQTILVIYNQSLGFKKETDDDKFDSEKDNIKALVLWLFCISAEQIFHNTYSSIIQKYISSNINFNEILEKRDELFKDYLKFDNSINGSATEGRIIFENFKEFINLDKKFQNFIENFEEIFAISRNKYYLNLEEQREFDKKQESERSKKMEKLIFFATCITIMTLISVLADSFSLWDRIVEIFK